LPPTSISRYDLGHKDSRFVNHLVEPAMRTTLFTLIASAVLFACGAATDKKVSSNNLCDSSPVVSADGTVATTRGCSFENQVYKIMTYGQQLSASGASLSDANGPVDGVVVTRQCDQYFLGADNAGTGFVMKFDGTVIQHAFVHPNAGFPLANVRAVQPPIAVTN
jgi:hypothetical protein